MTPSSKCGKTSLVSISLKVKIYTEGSSSTAIWKPLKNITPTQKEPMIWVLTNSHLLLMLSLLPSTFPLNLIILNGKTLTKQSPLAPPSIGKQKEWFPLLKIKEDVDHAGHSAPLEHWNLFHWWKENQLIYLNNSLLTAQRSTETQDAMEVSITKVWLMLRIMVSLIQQIIHMLQSLKVARWTEEISRFQVLTMPRDAQVSKLQLPQDQLVFQLMLINGVDILEVFSAIVDTALITMFFWSVFQTATGESRTLGELHGEKMDSLD